MKSIQCALCGEDQKIVTLYNSTLKTQKIDYRTFSARRIPDRMHYRLVKCISCGLIFSNPIIEEKRINSFYFQSDFNYNQEAEYLKKTYFNYLKKYVLSSDPKNIKVLEIGCGNGFILEELIDNGIKNVYGIEPGHTSVRKARSDIKNRIKISTWKKDLFPKNSFDVICCFHTLDHVIDPNKFVQDVYKSLKKDGKFFFIVHNTNGLSARLLGEKSPIFDIEHIYLFNARNLKELFYKNGFHGLETFSINNTYPINYWLKLLPLLSLLKNNMLKLLNITKIGLYPFSLSAGNVGIVGTKS